jgi:hypothetical protein
VLTVVSYFISNLCLEHYILTNIKSKTLLKYKSYFDILILTSIYVLSLKIKHTEITPWDKALETDENSLKIENGFKIICIFTWFYISSLISNIFLPVVLNILANVLPLNVPLQRFLFLVKNVIFMLLW